MLLDRVSTQMEASFAATNIHDGLTPNIEHYWFRACLVGITASFSG